MDAILIANECVDARLKSKEPGILCKLDIEKAYNHLNWNFLLETRTKMSFEDRDKILHQYSKVFNYG